MPRKSKPDPSPKKPLAVKAKKVPAIRDEVAAAHEAARLARRAGKPADVVEGHMEHARSLERREAKLA